MKKNSIIVFIYNSYKDPLFQNLLLNYIKTLSEKNDFRFDLITFEQTEYGMSKSEMIIESNKLEKWNIHWHPQVFHTGRFLLFQKFIDLLTTLWVLTKIRLKYHSTHIFAFANVAAALSWIASRILKMKLVIYSYEPHSEFLAELGHWKRSSLKYKLLSYLEKRAGVDASHVMTGTKHGVELLKSFRSKGTIFRAPTAVDPNEFYFRATARKTLRQKFNLDQKFVVLYIGKFGDLYYEQEVIQLFHGILDIIPESHLIIVTRFNHDKIKTWLSSRKIPPESYTLDQDIENEEVKEYISAADIGISAVPPSLSQKYRSPTKVAEYLLCGLPYITCAGVSEDDEVAEQEGVGIVVKKFSRTEIRFKKSELLAIASTEKEKLVAKHRSVGLEYRSKKKIDDLLFEIFTK